jgi:hypothetical protein
MKMDEFIGKYFVVTEIGDTQGIIMKTVTVGVLPYVIDNKILTKVGVLHELNKLRESGYAETIITGSADPDDKTLLETAIRELNEEGGFSVQDNDKWIFLGNFKTTKCSDEIISVFAVDITGQERGEVKGDGSEQEEKSDLNIVDVSDAILSNETLLLASFLRLFDYFYQKNTGK